MRRSKNLVNMLKHVNEYSDERKYKINKDLGQFMYNNNRNNNEIFKNKNIKVDKNEPIQPIKRKDEKYSSLFGFFESKPRLKRNMKIITAGILILIIGAGSYAIFNTSRFGPLARPPQDNTSIIEYLQSHEDIKPDEKDMEEKMMVLEKSGGDIYTISKGPHPYRTIGKFNSEDGEDTILLINIDKETKNDSGDINIDQRKLGILMHKDNDGKISFKMAEIAPSIPIFFNYKQQSVSISPSDYKTTLKSTDIEGNHRPLIKAAVYAAYKLKLIDIEETRFGKI